MRNPSIFIVQVIVSLAFLFGVMAWTVGMGHAALVDEQTILKVIQK